MRGAFGGERVQLPEGTSEALAPELAPLLAKQDAGPRLASRSGDPERAALLVLEGEGPRLHYAGSLGESQPLDAEGLARSTRLAALAASARTLAELHAQGRAHGDLRPSTVWVAGEQATVLVTAGPVDANALLRARLRAGVADPAQVAFAAPELLGAEGQASPAGDVYALSALAYALLAGRPPQGRLDLGLVTADLPDAVTLALSRGLHPEPAQRPPLRELEQAFRLAAAAWRDMEAFAPADGEPPDEVRVARLVTAAERAAAAAEEERGTQVSLILIFALLVGGAFVLAGALGLVIAGWDTIGELGRFAFLLLLTGGVWGAGSLLQRRDYERSGFSLVCIGTQLLWVDLAYLLFNLDLEEEPGPWALGSGLIAALLFVEAARRRSVVLGLLSALGFTVTSLTFGAHISTGSDLGPAVYTLIVAAAYGGLAVLGDRLRGPRLALPFFGGAVFWAWASALAGLFLMAQGFDAWGWEEARSRRAVLWGTLWPYLVLGALLLPAWRLRGTYRIVGLISGLAVLVVVPSAQSFIGWDQLAYLLASVGLSLGVLAAAFHVPRLREAVIPQTVTILIGLFGLSFAPAIHCWGHCFDEDGLSLLEEALRSGGRVHETDFVYLSIVVGLAAGLVALGFLFARHAARKSSYRMLEVTGLLLYFGVLPVLSLPDADDEFFYALLILGGAAAVIVLGLVAQRASLVAIASVALLVNLLIQYVAKLQRDVHWGLLALGFGIAVLVLSVLYERKIKHLLPKLRSWA